MFQVYFKHRQTQLLRGAGDEGVKGSAHSPQVSCPHNRTQTLSLAPK